MNRERNFAQGASVRSASGGSGFFTRPLRLGESPDEVKQERIPRDRTDRFSFVRHGCRHGGRCHGKGHFASEHSEPSGCVGRRRSTTRGARWSDRANRLCDGRRAVLGVPSPGPKSPCNSIYPEAMKSCKRLVESFAFRAETLARLLEWESNSTNSRRMIAPGSIRSFVRFAPKGLASLAPPSTCYYLLPAVYLERNVVVHGRTGIARGSLVFASWTTTAG